MKSKGWDVNAPADPVGGRFGRNPDGSLDGQGFELPVLFAVVGEIMATLGNPLVAGAKYYAEMARAGYTSTSDMTFELNLKAGYEALAAAPSCPLRVSMFEVSTSDTYTEPVSFAAGAEWLVKQGVKLWTWTARRGSATSGSRFPTWTPRRPGEPGSTRRRPADRIR